MKDWGVDRMECYEPADDDEGDFHHDNVGVKPIIRNQITSYLSDWHNNNNASYSHSTTTHFESR
jgi:hypothetical protein